MAYRGSKQHIDYMNKWIKDKKVRVTILLDKECDTDIMSKLNSVPNKTDYIRQLIRADIEDIRP